MERYGEVSDANTPQQQESIQPEKTKHRKDHHLWLPGSPAIGVLKIPMHLFNKLIT
jgi:hypothetical protein